MIRVGINGFGRIGRAFFRINLKNKLYKIEAINDIDPDVSNIAYLLQYDSTYGKIDEKVTVNGNKIKVGDKTISVYNENQISSVPWETHNIDVVIDSSGIHDNVINSKRLIGRVKKVIVTHSPKDGVDITLMNGVNEKKYKPYDHHIISSSICDANAVSPFIKIIEESFGIENGNITTLHPWLSYQNLLDGNLKSISSPGHFWTDYALGRSSLNAMIPKKTSLMSALNKVFKNINSKINAMSFRTPTSIVSIADGTFLLKENVSKNDVIETLRIFSKQYPSVIYLNERPLVSVDFLKSEFASNIDLRWLDINGKLLKFVIWYDNEWGYASVTYNLVNLILHGNSKI